jgi:hypothetical protein
MKRSLLILICLAAIISTYGQYRPGQAIIEVTKVKDSIITKVQVSGFPVEDSAWWSHIENQVKAAIVTDIDKHAKQGKYTLVVYFVLSKDGDLSDIRCDNDPGYGICEAAIRIIKKSKKWGPAGNGYPVRPYRH